MSNTRLVASALVGLVRSLLERALACCKRVCHVRNRLDLLGLDHDLDHLANLNLDERTPGIRGLMPGVRGGGGCNCGVASVKDSVAFGDVTG